MEYIEFEDMLEFLLAIKKEIDNNNFDTIYKVRVKYINGYSYHICCNNNNTKEYFIYPKYRKNLPHVEPIIDDRGLLAPLTDWIKRNDDKLEKFAKLKGFW